MALARTLMVVMLKIAVEGLISALKISLETVIVIQVTTTLNVVTLMEVIAANVLVWIHNFLVEVGGSIARTQILIPYVVLVNFLWVLAIPHA